MLFFPLSWSQRVVHPVRPSLWWAKRLSRVWVFFCGICGAHAFHPPAPKLQKRCGGPAKDRRVLAALRSGNHPDTRPPLQIGTPRQLFAHSRIFLDPCPMLPKNGGSGKRGNVLPCQSSSSGTEPASQRGKRDPTPNPRAIDFLSGHGKPKVPRVRSPSPNPYDMLPPSPDDVPAPVTPPPCCSAREFGSACGSGSGGR